MSERNVHPRQSESVYEYRVLKAGEHRPEQEGPVYRADDPVWERYDADALSAEFPEWNEDGPDASGLRGLFGIVEATRREALYGGAKVAWVERREVGQWETVTPWRPDDA